MGKLLKKEWILFSNPMNFLFMTFVFMLFIPSYPYYVMFFYILLGIFFSFLFGRENKDLNYMAMLPIKKEEIVLGKYLFVYSAQLLSVAISIPAIVLRCTTLNYENQAGIEANPAFLGFTFVMFAAFNAIFLGSYFKNAYKVGFAFAKGSTAMGVIVVAAEASTYLAKGMTGACFWDSTKSSDLGKQVPILLIGLAIYVFGAYASFKRDRKNFFAQDL